MAPHKRAAAQRWRASAARTRRSVLPALQMTAAGVGAYVIAEQVLGHEAPLFAAVAALIAMGFTKEARLRKVVEVAVGCTLGVLIADMLVHALGQGVPVAVLVVFLAVMLARFLDPSPVLAMQMGLQALLVVMLPAPDGGTLGPFTRSLDAVVGGLTAFMIAMLTPKDPRGEPIRALRGITDQLARSLRETGTALRTSDSREAWHALIRARGIQSLVDEVSQELSSAKELVTYSPAHRRHRRYVRRLEEVSDALDLTVRSLRVVNRRAASAINHASISDDGVEALAHTLDEMADATMQLSQAVSHGESGFERTMENARDACAAVATQLHPRSMGVDDLEGEAIVLMLRTMVVDLLRATGTAHEDALDYLPSL